MPAAPGDRGKPGSTESSAKYSVAPVPLGSRASKLPGEEDCAGFLDGKNPRELLEALLRDDPLRLFERCSRYLWAEALLLELERLHHHAAAGVAATAATRHDQPFEEWLHGCIETAAQALVGRDQEDERAGNPVTDPWGARHHFICEALGRPPEDGRRACTAFNGLPSRVRRAFFALAMERRTVQECVEAGLGPPDRLRADSLRALGALLDLGENFDPKSNRGQRGEDG